MNAKPCFTRWTAVASIVALLALGGCATRGTGAAAATPRAPSISDSLAADALPAPANTDNLATYVQLVGQMQQKGLYFASLAHIDALQQRWGADADSNLLKADALRHTGQAEPARLLYSQLLNSPAKARAAHGLGLLASRAGDLAGAATYFTQAMQAAPTDGAILNDLGYVLMQQGQWPAARVPLMKASELAGDNPRVWSNVALFLTLDGQDAQAQKVMDSHQLPAATRSQVAEQARAIQQRHGLADSGRQAKPTLVFAPALSMWSSLSGWSPDPARAAPARVAVQ